jgi:lipoprotein-anchoring transpeptidase ErfK/SrfK
MRTMTQIRIQAAAMLLAVAGIEAAGQAGQDTEQTISPVVAAAVSVQVERKLALNESLPAAAPTVMLPIAPAGRVIVVSLEDRRLALVQDGAVKKVYTVAVGKPSTPSPAGSFTIESRVANPTYSHAGKTVLPGPGNPVGTRWMGLSIHGYGIHGTNAPSSIGKAVSHGCIRMGKTDLEELFSMVRPGDMVRIVGERNGETAQLFGVPATQTGTATPLEAASVPVESDKAPAVAAINIAAGDVPAVLPAR